MGGSGARNREDRRTMKSKILSALREAPGYVSGQELCDELQVSRTAVWKVINQLKEEGYVIESVPRKGYRLVSHPDSITAEEVKSRMTKELSDWKIVYYDEIDSTNNEAKRFAENGETQKALFIAEQQSGGKGRRGRTWITPRGSAIAMSLLLPEPEIAPDHASMVTLVIGLAVTKACREFCKVDAKLKWPNDVVCDGQKLSGTLTEMSSEVDYINYLVIGTGINANVMEFPEELSKTAASLKLLTGKQTDRAGLIACCMKYFAEYYEKFLQTQDLSLLMEEYNELLAGTGGKVRVLEPGHEYCGVSRGINALGELLVETKDGNITQVYAGEVSVRGIYGYV